MGKQKKLRGAQAVAAQNAAAKAKKSAATEARHEELDELQQAAVHLADVSARGLNQQAAQLRQQADQLEAQGRATLNGMIEKTLKQRGIVFGPDEQVSVSLHPVDRPADRPPTSVSWTTPKPKLLPPANKPDPEKKPVDQREPAKPVDPKGGKAESAEKPAE